MRTHHANALVCLSNPKRGIMCLLSMTKTHHLHWKLWGLSHKALFSREYCICSHKTYNHIAIRCMPGRGLGFHHLALSVALLTLCSSVLKMYMKLWYFKNLRVVMFTCMPGTRTCSLCFDQFVITQVLQIWVVSQS